MKHTIILFSAALALFLSASQVQAREDRTIVQNQLAAIQDKAAVFQPGGAWFPFPAYKDRKGWDKLLGSHKEAFIKAGEKYLQRPWAFIAAHEFLEFEKDGDRKHIKEDNNNKAAMGALMMAELAEGKGRFLQHLADGLYYYAERATWSYAVHTNRQNSHRHLPDPDERIISLGSANTGGYVATALYFFKDEFDKMDPTISRAILYALDENIFKPYLDDNKIPNQFWLGFNRKDGGHVRNWTTHCTTLIMQAFLLCEPNQETLIKAIERSAYSIDQYLDDNALDGCCDEGPSYWDMAGGKLYDYARMMYDASGGRIDIFGDEQFRRIGEYKVKTYIGDGWVLPFADGGARAAGSDPLIFRYGLDAGSKELENFGLYLAADPKRKRFKESIASTGQPIRVLYTLLYEQRMREAEQAALDAAGGDFDKMYAGLLKPESEYYAETEVATLRNKAGWFLGVKGGNNGESHNHNDVGSGVFFVDSCPVFIDAGVMTYRKETFSSLRYTLWCMRSDWHTTPTINGVVQNPGREFSAKGSSCSLKDNSFSTDIAGAYPEEAACTSWQRSYKLDNDSVTITDRFRLKERKAADEMNFLCQGKITREGDHVVIETHSFDGKRVHRIAVSYSKGLTPQVEEKEMDDPRFFNVWGEKLYRIRFVSSEKAPLSGSYTFTFKEI